MESLFEVFLITRFHHFIRLDWSVAACYGFVKELKPPAFLYKFSAQLDLIAINHLQLI